jgi:hypothetical protein
LRYRAFSRFALVVCAAGLALAGCKNSSGVSFTDTSSGGWFSKPIDVFAKPSWASAAPPTKNVQLNPAGPVAPEQLVTADGRCSVPIVEAAPPAAPATPAPTAAPAAPADRPVGSIAGDLARAPMPAATPVSANPNPAPLEQPPGEPQVMGGIALGMSECDVVRRAGLPGNVNIGAGDKGERKVVLTYLTGTWPGIYTFDNGRLKIVDRAPEPAPAAKPPAKKKRAKKPAKPKTASNHEFTRAYVQ